MAGQIKTMLIGEESSIMIKRELILSNYHEAHLTKVYATAKELLRTKPKELRVIEWNVQEENFPQLQGVNLLDICEDDGDEALREDKVKLKHLFHYLDEMDHRALKSLIFQTDTMDALDNLVAKLRAYTRRELKKVRTRHPCMKPYGPVKIVQYKMVTFLIRLFTHKKTVRYFMCLCKDWNKKKVRTSDKPIRYPVVLEYLMELVNEQPQELAAVRKQLTRKQNNQLSKLLKPDGDEQEVDNAEEEEDEGDRADKEKEGEVEVAPETDVDRYLALTKFLRLGRWRGALTLKAPNSETKSAEIHRESSDNDSMDGETSKNVKEWPDFPFAKIYRTFVQIVQPSLSVEINKIDRAFKKKIVPAYAFEKKELYKLYNLINLVDRSQWKSNWTKRMEIVDVERKAAEEKKREAQKKKKMKGKDPKKEEDKRKAKEKAKELEEKKSKDPHRSMKSSIMPVTEKEATEKSFELPPVTLSPISQLLNFLAEFFTVNVETTIDVIVLRDEKREDLLKRIGLILNMVDESLDTDPYDPLIEKRDLNHLKTILDILIKGSWERRYLLKRAIIRKEQKDKEKKERKKRKLEENQHEITFNFQPVENTPKKGRKRNNYDSLMWYFPEKLETHGKRVTFAEPLVSQINGRETRKRRCKPKCCDIAKMRQQISGSRRDMPCGSSEMRQSKCPVKTEAPLNSSVLRVMKATFIKDLVVAPKPFLGTREKKRDHSGMPDCKMTDDVDESDTSLEEVAEETIKSAALLESEQNLEDESLDQYLKFEIMSTVKNWVENADLDTILRGQIIAHLKLLIYGNLT